MLHQLPKELLLEQVNNGLILMLLGMGFVFVFLTLLVFSTTFLSSMVRKYAPEKSKPVTSRPTSVSSVSAPETAGSEIAVAITAAVAQSKQ
ncbi:MAG: OadG family protein [Sphaerochaetaceae bacterium]|jgi:oxaloacetate decarboxylase gamma subunit